LVLQCKGHIYIANQREQHAVPSLIMLIHYCL